MTIRSQRKFRIWTMLTALTNYHLGRYIIGSTILIGFAFEFFADWSSTHIFNPAWHPHARFHNAVHVFHFMGLVAMTLWLLSKPRKKDRTAMKIAALMPALWGLSFFAAAAVPGISLEPYPNAIPRIGPFILNIFICGLAIVFSLAGYLIDRAEEQEVEHKHSKRLE